MEKYRNVSLFIILISTPDFPHFYYMLGGNLGSLLYGDVSVINAFRNVLMNLGILLRQMQIASSTCSLIAFIFSNGSRHLQYVTCFNPLVTNGLTNSYFMLFGEGVSCRILYSIVSYLYVSCSGSITSVEEEGVNLICLLSFTFKYVVSVRRGCLFLLVLGLCCVILLWHSLSLPYNYLI